MHRGVLEKFASDNECLHPIETRAINNKQLDGPATDRARSDSAGKSEERWESRNFDPLSESVESKSKMAALVQDQLRSYGASAGLVTKSRIQESF